MAGPPSDSFREPGGGALDRPGVPASAARLMRLATWASVGVAGSLVLVKLFAWFATDSVSILSTLVDSMLDVAASLINLLAVRHALTPADREHRFGHGKAEPLAALGQAAFIAGSASLLLFEASHRLYQPVAISNGATGIAVMVFSIAVTVALVVFQGYVVRRTASFAIRADSLHYRGDILVNASVIVSLVLAERFGWLLADPLFGGAIAFYILFNAWAIAKGALDMLMDREMPDRDRARIRQLALAHPEVRDIHDLRTRLSGPQAFIQLHLEMDGELRLVRAHEIADEVEAAIVAAFPGAEVIIHEDPEGIDETRREFA